MEVIMIEDLPSLGYVGDKVSVKSGYARNYLLPRGIAVEAASSSAKRFTHLLSGINSKKAKKRAEAEELKKRLEELSIEFMLKAGEHGKSFGSVTAHDIFMEFQNRGFALDRKQIRVHESIKSGGTFPVQVKLHSEVTATVNVKVKVDVSEIKASDKTGDRAEEPRRRHRGEGRRGDSRKRRASAESEAGEAAPEPKERKPRKEGKQKAEAPKEEVKEEE